MKKNIAFYRALFGISLGTLIIFGALLIIKMQSSPESEPITELNQQYEGEVLKIFASDIQVVSDPFKNDSVIIGIRFVIENASEKDFFLGPSSFSAYIDDIVTQGQTTTNFNEAGEELHGNIAPGKSVAGYYSVNASKSADKVEIRIEEIFERKYATFIFDIPPIEN